jgi:putative chitinase
MNISNLNGHIPQSVIVEIPLVMTTFHIDTQLRLAHFLAQCAHESGRFLRFRENLNYGAVGLRNVFGKYFPNDAIAAAYARKPEKIANRVYANRMGNGPETSGDGYRFRGRGFIQVTGRSNYTLFDAIAPESIIANPDLVATTYPLFSAGWFWTSRNINKAADKGATDSAVLSVTKLVNGGTTGLAERQQLFHTYYPLLS